LNPAYISALAALAGAIIGGLTSFATSWLTQRTQLRHAHREAERAELKTLYEDFIASASRLYIEALTNKIDDINDITGLVGLYAMDGRMRLVSDQTVIDAARRAEDTIIETYLGPDQTVRELMDYARLGGQTSERDERDHPGHQSVRLISPRSVPAGPPPPLPIGRGVPANRVVPGTANLTVEMAVGSQLSATVSEGDL
jgi:hypothetical protein